MKRGNLLIALLVLLAAVSIFSTGLYANFLDTFTGNSFSFVTGNMVSITGEAGAPAETDTNQKVKGEHCTANRDCYSYSSPQISNACRGTNKYCYDQLPAANEQPKRGIGRICNLNSQCLSGKCSNGICGKKRGETCANNGQCLSGDCFDRTQCDYSNPTSSDPNDLCSDDTDCTTNEEYKCSNFHRCIKVTELRNYDAACTYNPECLSGNCNNGKCAKSADGELCESITDCSSNVCGAGKKCSSGTGEGVSACTSWKNCNANQYCKQDGTCATDNRQITERKCVEGSYETKIGKGEKCRISIFFSSGTDANLAYFQREGCTSNSQCQLTIGGTKIYNYCKKNGFCDARLFADGRGCKTRSSLCAINEDCDTATNKCEARPEELVDLPDAGGGDVEGYSPQNAQMAQLRDAINNAINFLLPRIQAVVREHDIPVTGRFTNVEITVGQNNNAPAATLSLSEWISTIAGMDGRMQSIEDQICAESFRHPEIENDGLPCVRESPIQKSAFSTMFGRLTGRG